MKLEYIFPHMLTTCMYGIVFIILGNLSGNAIAFGIYVMSAAGYDDPSRGSVIGLAVGALSCACLVHVASRRGGIILNNIFAVVKVAPEDRRDTERPEKPRADPGAANRLQAVRSRE